MTTSLEREIGRPAAAATTYAIELERFAHPFGRAIEAIGPFQFLRPLLSTRTAA
jgi:hypothetical protein